MWGLLGAQQQRATGKSIAAIHADLYASSITAFRNHRHHPAFNKIDVIERLIRQDQREITFERTRLKKRSQNVKVRWREILQEPVPAGFLCQHGKAYSDEVGYDYHKHTAKL